MFIYGQIVPFFVTKKMFKDVKNMNLIERVTIQKLFELFVVLSKNSNRQITCGGNINLLEKHDF